MTTTVPFSESYYRRVLDEFGYTSFDLEQFNFSLAGLDADTLNMRYLCHHHGDRYLRVEQNRRIITTGFGISGVPHLATVSQILKMVEFQQGGEICQIVLGDLDVYNGKAKPYAEICELTEKFHKYCLLLGFDSESGILRRQQGHLPSLETMYLIGHYVDQADFDIAEEDNHRYYADCGIVDAAMTFPRCLSLALMAADFVALGQCYDAVLVMLGVDEHRYVRFAQQAVKRFEEFAPLRSGFDLSAVYTRMQRGFGGYPKFSKSIPGSSIDVTTPPDQLRRLLAETSMAPEDSVAYQLMCQMPGYDADKLVELHRLCLDAGPAWQREVSEFADCAIDLVKLWPC